MCVWGRRGWWWWCRLDQPGLKLVGSSSHMSPETKEFLELFNKPDLMQASISSHGGGCGTKLRETVTR